MKYTVEKLYRYKAEDGSIFENFEEAEQHNIKLILIDVIANLGGSEMQGIAELVADTIIKNFEVKFKGVY